MTATNTYSQEFRPNTGFRGNRWWITVVVTDLDGRWECTGLHVKSADGSPVPITTSVLRQIPVSRLIQATRVAAENQMPTLPPDATFEESQEHHHRKIESTRRMFSPLREGKPLGRKPMYGIAHFERVAATYNDANRAGRSPTLAVAKKFKVSKSTAAKWVHRCRTEFGLLPETSRGKSRSTSRKKRKA